MKNSGTIRVIAVYRRRGRPRLPVANYRVECTVPPAVFNKLVQVESQTGTYRTRVAAHVLCNWAGVTPSGNQQSSSYAS
jgi:hypothetical protein